MICLYARLRIIQWYENKKVLKASYAVRLLKDGESWDTITYTCSANVLISVDEKLWPFLASVASPQERVKLVRNKGRCQKLLQITEQLVVGVALPADVCLGTVRFVGNVKGLGKCFGIQLHEKQQNNQCDGFYAGVQYFKCPRGHGIFTTIDKLIIAHDYTADSPIKNSPQSELDASVERNLSKFTENYRAKDDASNNSISNKTSNNFRTSHSMQNIYDIKNQISINTTNDFDQNSILQPEKTHLINDVRKMAIYQKMKSEVDLKDVIGNIWSDRVETVKPNSYAHLRRDGGLPDNPALLEMQSSPIENFNSSLSIKNGNGIVKSPRNKSSNPISHLVNGSKTVPKKTKYNLERTSNKEKNTFLSTKSINISPKLSEQEEKTHNGPSTSYSTSNIPLYYDPEPGMTNDLTIGSLVEVNNDVSEEPLYGVIRWMGVEGKSQFVMVGVELEEEQLHLPLTLTDGVHNGHRFFTCSSNRALFVPLGQCQHDSRFADGVPTPLHSITEKTFGMECPIVQGCVAPLIMSTEEDVEAVCGKFRGIQGHHNSCYLDATLFAMFTYTSVFDSLLYRPKSNNDIPLYEEVQRVLREEIVNPLRKNLFVRADRVMNLRKLLDQLSSVSGLTSEEKDPEEFLNSLLAQILKAEPFLKLNSGQEAYHYQLFVEKDDALKLPTVQQLFEQSFLTSDIKLKEVPSCLIIQMPRFGKSYKMYPRILPSQLLDVTDVIENSPRQCAVCGRIAVWECRECFGECGVGLESIAFCEQCLKTVHSHNRRSGHSPRSLTVCHDYRIMEEHCSPPRLFMELFAVVCIETSHYVAFVKCGVGHEAPWCFFDSMADRKGEKNGYNIPEMVACPDVSKWLSDEQICRQLHESSPHDRHLPEHARRLLCDAYISG
ncbi:CYLD [Trypoxylus dichotomus]